MEEKQNYLVRIDLLKLNSAFMRSIKGKTETKRCLIIPVDDNPSMYLGTKGCYLNLEARETREQKYDDTHFLKPSLPKDVREAMTEEQRNAIPIIGNMRPIKKSEAQQMTVAGGMDAASFAEEDDLPF